MINKNALLRSIILFGPPGSGKTTIACIIISNYQNDYKCIKLNAINFVQFPTWAAKKFWILLLALTIETRMNTATRKIVN